ncbi:hypothetical protein AB6P03_09980 [Streptococcus mutans]|uniref:hypothetical protein n=1 Tax=Streptococcus mutans TaxID=1309 RepID=UPI0038B85ED7
MTDSKQVQIIIRTTKEEKNEIMEESKEKGVSMNEFIKEKLFGSSKKDINSDIIDILREQVSIKDEQIKELHHLLYNRDTKLLESPKHWWQFWKS